MRLKQGKVKKLRSDFRKLHCATGCREQPAALLSAANLKATHVDADREDYGKGPGAMEESMGTPNVSITIAHGLVAPRPRGGRKDYNISTSTCIYLNASCFSLPQFQSFPQYLDQCKAENTPC